MPIPKSGTERPCPECPAEITDFMLFELSPVCCLPKDVQCSTEMLIRKGMEMI